MRDERRPSERLPVQSRVAAYRIVQESTRDPPRAHRAQTAQLRDQRSPGAPRASPAWQLMRDAPHKKGDSAARLGRARVARVLRARDPAAAPRCPRGSRRTAARFRLNEIDALLRRSLVYATVTALLLGAYVGLLLIGPLPGTGQGLAVSLVTAIPVALLFGPLRRRLQRTVNRMLYGEDDDPHAAVRELGRSLAGSLAPAAVLPTVVETVMRTLRVPYAAILLEREGEPRARGRAGHRAGRAPVPAAGLRRRAGGRARDRVASGRRALGRRPAAAGRTARQAGVAVHAVRLAADLQRSRERLVTARGGAPPPAPRPARRARPHARGDAAAAAGRRAPHRHRQLRSRRGAQRGQERRRAPPSATSAASSTSCARPRSTSSASWARSSGRRRRSRRWTSGWRRRLRSAGCRPPSRWPPTASPLRP